jgi:hypothetical protein
MLSGCYLKESVEKLKIWSKVNIFRDGKIDITDELKEKKIKELNRKRHYFLESFKKFKKLLPETNFLRLANLPFFKNNSSRSFSTETAE